MRTDGTQGNQLLHGLDLSVEGGPVQRCIAKDIRKVD